MRIVHCRRLTGYAPIAQMSDFFRFGVKFVEELYAQQPSKNAPGAWKCVLPFYHS